MGKGGFKMGMQGGWLFGHILGHMAKDHDMLMQPSRSSHPSTQPKGLCQQDHVYMDKRILGNPLAHLRKNEQKEIDQSKHKAIFEWDHLQVGHGTSTQMSFSHTWDYYNFGAHNFVCKLSIKIKSKAKL